MGASESVEEVQGYSVQSDCAPHNLIVSLHKPVTLLKWEVQMRHNLYFSLILSGKIFSPGTEGIVKRVV